MNCCTVQLASGERVFALAYRPKDDIFSSDTMLLVIERAVIDAVNLCYKLVECVQSVKNSQRFHYFLAERRQRVRVQGIRFGWLDLMGSKPMPHGSLLGLLLFLLLVDDFNTNCSIHKFVDDTTLTEILCRSKSVFHATVPRCI